MDLLKWLRKPKVEAPLPLPESELIPVPQKIKPRPLKKKGNE